MQSWTNGYFLSTAHRVIVDFNNLSAQNSIEKTKIMGRTSLVFFVTPNWENEIRSVPSTLIPQANIESIIVGDKMPFS